MADFTTNYNYIPPEQVEFEDYMPAIDRIKSMCDEYPALQKAFERFRTTYQMVQDDFDSKKDDECL